MCDLCNNLLDRNYTHSKTSQHKKNLIKLFKQLKANELKNINKKYGK
jgi:hypothetical protein